MDPLGDTPGIDKSWLSPYSGVKADKAERASKFVNALITSTLLSENKIEQALNSMNQLDVRGKVMLLNIVTNPLNNQLFSEVAKEVIFFNINTNIDIGHVSYSHASQITDGQIADRYFGKYLPKHDNQIELPNLIDMLPKSEIKKDPQQPNKIELLMLQQQEKKQKQLEEQKQISQEDIVKALIESGSVTCKLLPKIAPKSFYEEIADKICHSKAPELVVDNILEGLLGIVEQLPEEYSQC
ncbi:hypothetical protein [Candidatus Trichorickettsia mobilis]|uniref:hypothetical protein n=1 Tax=Candidatus Trichorickettsia mobilis TaxID=1346319 RepID=UPI0029319930|nr:hypothetical protein [Candidatus Trichorickettsia mobilis]